MILLAIDSSAKTAAAAICTEDRILAETTLNNGLTHSQTLIPVCHSLFANAQIELDELDGFAISAGPGSFTGLRIGMAAVKGMAFAANKPCYPVSTLEALAYNLIGMGGILCPVIDARRGQVYNALFEEKDGALVRICPDRAVSVTELSGELTSSEQPVWLCGDGAELSYQEMKKRIPSLCLAPLPSRFQRGFGVASAAFHSLQAVSARDLRPSYLRLPQAERERAERLETEQNQKERKKV